MVKQIFVVVGQNRVADSIELKVVNLYFLCNYSIADQGLEDVELIVVSQRIYE